LQGVEVAEFDFALLRLKIELRKNRDLDGAGRGKRFIGVKLVFLPGREIKDGDAKDAVKIAVHPADGRFQLLPQNLFFLLSRFFLRNLLREGRHWDANHESEQSEKEKSLEHGDLRVSGIIRPNGRAQGKSHACKLHRPQAGWTVLQEARCGGEACLLWNT